MLYGASVWDPVLIIAQIVSLQCLFCLGLGLWEAIFIAPYTGSRLTVAHLFDWRLMNFRHYTGWMIMLCNLANALLLAVLLMLVVERAKKCLDFGSTTYLLHFTACWWYSGFPASLEWWGTNSIGLVIASVLGEWLCVRREMADIPLNALRSRPPPSSAGASASSNAAASSSSDAAARSSSNAAAKSNVTPRAISASVGGRPLVVQATSGGGRGTGSNRSGAGAQRNGNSGLQLTAVSGSMNDQGRISRTNSRSRLLGGDEEV